MALRPPRGPAGRDMRRNSRTRTIWSMLTTVASVLSYSWAKRAMGTLAASSFVAWRVWRRLDLTSWILWGWEQVITVISAYELAATIGIRLEEAHAPGQLDPVRIGLGLVVAATF